MDAVVLALELHDLRPAGEPAGDAHGVHRRLGPGHGHSRHLDPAGELLDELGDTDLILAREAEAHAPAHPLVHVVVHAIVAMAEDHGTVAHAQVDELVPVEVPDAAALAPIDVDRVLAPGPEVRVRPAGQAAPRSRVHRVLAIAPERGRRSSGRSGGHEFLRWAGACDEASPGYGLSAPRTPARSRVGRTRGRRPLRVAGHRSRILAYGSVAVNAIFVSTDSCDREIRAPCARRAGNASIGGSAPRTHRRGRNAWARTCATEPSTALDASGAVSPGVQRPR